MRGVCWTAGQGQQADGGARVRGGRGGFGSRPGWRAEGHGVVGGGGGGAEHHVLLQI